MALLFTCSNLLFSQTKPAAVKPFIVEGQLKNFKGDKLLLAFTNAQGERIYEYTNIAEDGNFRLETDKVDRPVDAGFQGGGIYITGLIIAPGSHLTLTADCSDRKTASLTKKIKGFGSIPNQYLFKRDSLLFSSTANRDAFAMSPTEVLAYIKEKFPVRDSLYRTYYAAKTSQDNYYAFFKKKDMLNIQFNKLDLLLYSVARDTSMNYLQTIKFVNANGDRSLLNDLFKEEYMASDSYVTFMRESYPVYLLSLQNKKKGVKFNRETYQADIADLVASNYKGSIEQRVLFTQMQAAVRNARSFSEINLYTRSFKPLISQLIDKSKQVVLQELLINKEKELITTQIGKPAPGLSAETVSGKKYTLADFKGKVLLVDLWASWCGPCRQETPYLKQTFEKYKNDNRIAFVSVAVLDKPDAWRKAMDEDKPTWLQLYDTDGSVQRNYVANSIPKFIVVNKEGNIVSFDAPMPDSPDLEKMLLDEMSK